MAARRSGADHGRVPDRPAVTDQPEAARRARWHERTFEQSLQTASARALTRGYQFVRAALELLAEQAHPDLTVAEVVERSGMSVRSFYHHFGTRDDLLLAVMEEAARRHHHRVRRKLEQATTPAEELQAFVVSFFGVPEEEHPASRGIAMFHQRLAESRPSDYAALLEPHLDVLSDILARCAGAGMIRTDVAVDALALFVLNTLVTGLNLRVIARGTGAQGLTAEEMWTMFRPALVNEHRPVEEPTR